MREKWTRSPWVSTTAMFSFQRCLVASASTAAISFFAVSRVIGVPYGISKGVPSAVPPEGGGAAGAAGAGVCAWIWALINTAPQNINEVNNTLRILIPPEV